MRAFAWLCVLMSIILILSGCTYISSTLTEKITAPQNNAIQLEGKWHIERSMNKGLLSSKNNEGSQWAGKEAEFSKDGIKIGDTIWTKPAYKVKRVNSDEYFLYKYGINASLMGFEEKEVFVTTITSGDKFLYDFVKLDDKSALLIIQDNIYMLKKVSDKVDNDFSIQVSNKQIEDLNQASGEEKLLRSGVMLGIRSIKKSGAQAGVLKNEKEYSYKTLWIDSRNRTLRPVLQTENIFLPRMNGFWKVEPIRIVENGKEEDILQVYSPYQLASEKTGMSKLDSVKWGSRTGIINKSILFIGNDYVSLDISGAGEYINNGGKWLENRLQILPIDNVASEKGVNIYDLAGENGISTLKSAKVSLLNSLEDLKPNYTEMNAEIEEENISLARRAGHWFMKGRFNYLGSSNPMFVDFNINLIPPFKLVRFDNLCVPWTSIKDRVPDAIDAYTSPNKDIAVILSNGRLLVYSITDSVLDRIPLTKVKLREGDAVVMAEWALGDYVNTWEESFLKNEVKRVDEK